MKRDAGPGQRTALVLGTVFALLALGIIIVGYGYYRNYEAQYRAQVEAQLSAIADLKASELAQYRQERLADAAILFDNPVFSEEVARFLNNPQDAAARRAVQTWLDKYQAYNQYNRVRLLDSQGVARLSVPADDLSVSGAVTDHTAAALQSGRVAWVDFHRHAEGQPVYLTLLIPIINVQTGQRPIGVLELRIDPAVYLYPYIQRWPTPSKSGETLLIRRDGSDALYLNELRFQANAALTVRVSLDRTEVPAVRAALGQSGIVYGLDYRDVPVVGYVRAVPDSPWFIVAKIDDAEAFAPLAGRLLEMLTLVGALLFGTGAGVGLIWRQQRTRFYRERLAVTDALRESERLLRESQAIAGLGTYVLDLRTGQWRSSAILDAIFGIDANFARTIDSWGELVHPDWREQLTAYLANEVVGQRRRFDREYPIVRVQDGAVRWVQGQGELEFDVQGRPIKMTGTIMDITVRKQVEEALRDSEEKHRVLFMDSPDAYLIIMDGVVVDCNRATAILLGGDRAQIIGQTPDALSPEFQPDGQLSTAVARDKINTALQTGRNTFEWVHRRLDGADFQVEVSIASMSLAGKSALFTTWRDITERKRTENLIRARLALMEYSTAHSLAEVLQKTLDQVGELTNSPIGFYHFVESDQTTLSLQAWSTRTLQEFCRAQGAGAHYPVDQAGVWADCVHTHQPVVHNDYATLPNRKGLPDGHAHVARELVVPILRGDNVVGILGIGNKPVDYTDADVDLVRYFADVAWEIAERKRAEEALHETNAYLENLINYANAPIIVWDPHFKITRFNHAFEFLTGRREAEVIGQSLEMLFPPALIENSMALIHQTLHGERWETVEIEILHRDGSLRTVLWNSATLFAPDGETPVATIAQGQDITARKEVEAGLARAMADVQRSNRELEQFAYVASHDLQEPLRMVSSFTQLLEQRYSDQLDEKAKKYISYAVDGAVRMQRLINDLLTYSRINTKGQSLASIEARAVLAETLHNLSTTIAESGTTITYDALPTVRADATQLLQVFQNLISNAIKFRREDSPRIHVSARELGAAWLFSVADNGIGIEDQYAERVFVIFQRLHTRQEYPGTGIGLAVVKRIVERHGGKIWFESEPGQGTTFYFTLQKMIQGDETP